MHRVNQVSLRPGYLSIFSEAISTNSKSGYYPSPPPEVQMQKAGGLISDVARKKIRNSIDWLVYLAKPKSFYHNKFKKSFTFKVNFLTLTLSAPQIHSDAEIKAELLDHFLIQMKRKWKVGLYLWRAESQKNGNIHFHIVTDQFIPWSEARNEWNNIQAKLGYIERFRKKFPGRTPNSVDVKAVNKIRNLGAYLSKYCSKNSQTNLHTPIAWENGQPKALYNPEAIRSSPHVPAEGYRSIGGRLWGCSQSLSRLSAPIEILVDQVASEVQTIATKFKDRIYESSFVRCIYVNVSEWSSLVSGELSRILQAYYLQVNAP